MGCAEEGRGVGLGVLHMGVHGEGCSGPRELEDSGKTRRDEDISHLALYNERSGRSKGLHNSMHETANFYPEFCEAILAGGGSHLDRAPQPSLAEPPPFNGIRAATIGSSGWYADKNRDPGVPRGPEERPESPWKVEAPRVDCLAMARGT